MLQYSNQQITECDSTMAQQKFRRLVQYTFVILAARRPCEAKQSPCRAKFQQNMQRWCQRVERLDIFISLMVDLSKILVTSCIVSGDLWNPAKFLLPNKSLDFQSSLTTSVDVETPLEDTARPVKQMQSSWKQIISNSKFVAVSFIFTCAFLAHLTMELTGTHAAHCLLQPLPIVTFDAFLLLCPPENELQFF